MGSSHKVTLYVNVSEFLNTWKLKKKKQKMRKRVLKCDVWLYIVDAEWMRARWYQQIYSRD